MKPARLTVVVVSRGLEAMLGHCLDHVQNALTACGLGLDSWAVVLIDNASTPPYRLADWKRPNLHLMRVDRHHSFAAANNLAIKNFSASAYLLLNNDVLLCQYVVGHMLEIFNDQGNVGICGARMLFPDGTLQHGGVVFGGGDTGPYHHMRGVDHRVVATADRDHQAVTGACLLVRQSVWNLLGGLDESYCFGLEDIDFCLRARQNGWRVVCCNRSNTLHFESMTPGRVEMDVDSRRLFMERWGNRYTVDG